MQNIKEILIERDNLTENEADNLINDAREQLQEYLEDGDLESAQEICQEMFGLEPDYLFDLV